MLGKQLVGALAGAAYSAATTAMLFGVLSMFMRVRVVEEEEIEGIDERSHGEAAYARTPSMHGRTPSMRSHVSSRFYDDEDDSGLTSSSGAAPGTTSVAPEEQQPPKPQELHAAAAAIAVTV